MADTESIAGRPIQFWTEPIDDDQEAGPEPSDEPRGPASLAEERPNFPSSVHATIRMKLQAFALGIPKMTPEGKLVKGIFCAVLAGKDPLEARPAETWFCGVIDKDDGLIPDAADMKRAAEAGEGIGSPDDGYAIVPMYGYWQSQKHS